MRDHLADQIAIGRYRAGAYLPSVRELAKELGINRNTVSRVYLELRRDGVLESVRGLGVRVASRPDVGEGDFDLTNRLRSLVRDAYRARVSRETLIASLGRIARETYATLSVRVALVECTSSETEQLAREISKHLSVDVDSVLLADLIEDPNAVARRYDVISTTLFHLKEVRESLAGLPPTIVGMNHVLSHDTVLRITRLGPGTRIAIVCENLRTLALVQATVEAYAHGEVRGLTKSQVDELAKVATEVDVIVDHSLTHDLVRSIAPGIPTITATFHIEKQSIEFLRHTALERRVVTVQSAS